MSPRDSTAPGQRILCRLEDIEDGGAKGFVLGEGTALLDLFVVRQGRRLLGYVNACPHNGSPLDFLPDQFFDEDRRHLMCHTHGALFEIDSGACIDGPCKGDHLTPIAVALDAADQVVLMLERTPPE
jgi:nitrite reductase/ring-hydroxylating ferredoxin subunit